MHRVIVYSLKFSWDYATFHDANIYFDTKRSMKEWCRTTYGKGYEPDTKTWIWRSGTIVDPNDHFSEYVVFYFAKAEHATWFRLTW